MSLESKNNSNALQKQWMEYQNMHAEKIIKHDVIDLNKIRYIGGLDISFDKFDNTKACAYISIYDRIEGKIVYEKYRICQMTIPYISGFLGFREVPEYLQLLFELKNSEYSEFYPNVLMCDGFGIFHIRGFGSASHIGYAIDIPSIGIAKTLLCIDGLTNEIVKTEFKQKCTNKGDYILLTGNSGRVYGAAIKSTNITENPLFVSIGHNISLESAIKLVNETTFYRIPEPIRNSDIKSKLHF